VPHAEELSFEEVGAKHFLAREENRVGRRGARGHQNNHQLPQRRTFFSGGGIGNDSAMTSATTFASQEEANNQ